MGERGLQGSVGGELRARQRSRPAAGEASTLSCSFCSQRVSSSGYSRFSPSPSPSLAVHLTHSSLCAIIFIYSSPRGYSSLGFAGGTPLHVLHKSSGISTSRLDFPPTTATTHFYGRWHGTREESLGERQVRVLD
ncbi:MAG: hypothetical protein ACK56I_35030, partial [bacterium]